MIQKIRVTEIIDNAQGYLQRKLEKQTNSVRSREGKEVADPGPQPK